MEEPAKTDLQHCEAPDRLRREVLETREPTWHEFEINARDPRAAQRDLMDELFRSAADKVRELSKCVQTFCAASHKKDRQAALRSVKHQIRDLQGVFKRANLETLTTFCSSVERLAGSLAQDSSRINGSSMRTMSNGIDFLRTAIWPAFYRRQNEGEPIQILIVDDQVVCRVALLMALNAPCLKVTPANHGEEALQRAAITHFDVIFSDIMMPEIDGFDLAKKIHALPNNSTTPIIFVTALSDFASRSKSILSGGCDLLAKPFTPAEVLVKAFTVALTHRAQALNLRANEPGPVPNGVIHLDGHGHIQSVNADFTDLLGYTELDVLHWPLTLLFPDDLQRTLKTVTAGRLLAGEFRTTPRVLMIARRKNRPPVRVTVSVSETDDKSRRGFVALIRDSEQQPAN